MEKQLGWAHKLCGLEPLWISKVGHTVLARLMESQIWHQPTYWLCGGRAQQRGNGLCSPLCQTLQSLAVYNWCPSSCHLGAGAHRKWVRVDESMCGFSKKNGWGLQQPLPPSQYLLVSADRSCGELDWNPRLGSLVWVWDPLPPPAPEIIPPEFLSTSLWGQLVSRLCPSYQCGWMWFLQFHSCQTSIQLDFWCSWVMVIQ